MLPTGRSVVGQIFACDEGVLGFHNDRRAGGNMPANYLLSVIRRHISARRLTALTVTFIIKQALNKEGVS